ncbi:MAG: hypothetical protein AB9917_23945 [Negativicutes bacterium]
MVEEQGVKITREQLYKEIWEISVAGVAKKYNAAYNDLLKLCKEADIPVPPSGYWMKLEYGKPVEQILLPESVVFEVTLPGNDKPKRIRKTVVKESVDEDEDWEQEDESADEPEDDDNDEIDDDDADADESDDEDTSLSQWTWGGKQNIYKRKKLYREVWSQPVVKVAEKYGVSDVAIHKVCKTLNVPTPPLGYWAKVKAGAEVKKIPLPKTKGPTQTMGAKTYEGVREKISTPGRKPLDFLSEDEREKVAQAAKMIVMPAENAPLHKKIIAHRNQRFGAGMISNESLPRVSRILEALFRQVESLGGLVNEDLSMRIRNETVRLEIVEGQDKVPHVITKDEAKALLKYQDEKRHSMWASQPQIRKYDYVFNGRLRISVRQSRYFRDTDKVNVESRLGDIIIELYEESEKLRLERLTREEEARRKAEEERRREERRNRYNLEVDKTIGLENAAQDFQTACRIRDYVKAIVDTYGSNKMDAETAAWVEWAMKKAAWFDPTVAWDDELFGEREHEKGLSEKALKKHGQYW